MEYFKKYILSFGESMGFFVLIFFPVSSEKLDMCMENKNKTTLLRSEIGKN